MTINIADKLKSVIPDTIIDGKDASKTILVDTNENPIFMKNRAVLRTAEKKFDVHDDNGQLSFSIPLNDFDDTEILAAIASINASIEALESDVAEAGTTANNAKSQAELNKEDIVTLTTTANAADTLSKSNQTNLNELSTTVGGNAAAISANAAGIENNTTAISSKTDQTDHDELVTAVGTKADQSSLDTVSATATAADTLSKTNQGDISSITATIGDIESEVLTTKQIAQKANEDVSSLGQTVGANTSQISANTSAIASNETAINSKASQTSLDAVSTTATAADTLSKSNASSITGLNSAVDNNTAAIATKASQTDLNAVSATASAADTLSKSNKTRIDQIAEGAGDDSDYVSVNGFDGLNGITDLMASLDGDTQCNQFFNALRSARPVANNDAVQWVMWEYVGSNHDIWKFCPPDITAKDGLVTVVHKHNTACEISITTSTVILSKQLYFNIGGGDSGLRTDWQQWHPRIKGHAGFNDGQILQHDDISWDVSSNPRTNMQRVRDALPNNCTWIGWHNPNSSNQYKLVFHGESTNIESTSGIVVIFKRAGASSTGGFYINSASGAEGWTRVYLGQANSWAAFSKQDNRSTKARFEGVDKVSLPYYEEPPELALFVIASFSDDLLQTKAIDDDGEYESVGRYGVQWDGTWTRDESYHTAYYRQASNTYIAYDYAEFKWRKFTAAKQHTFLGQQAVASSIALFSPRSQFPDGNGAYVNFGDLDTLAYEQITQPTIVHDTANKTSTINFGAARWGYIEGGGVPDTSGEYPDDGIDPIPEPEE
tara:strand:+ start:2887 stop:5226 length:2340 start_codon:yes stop_codon:yes gene_type:complete